MASIQVNTNGQTLTVNASVSHWTTAALAVTASAANDVESTTTTTITAPYTLHFSNTATTALVTVRSALGGTLISQTFDVSAGTGPRTLNPVPDAYQVAASRPAGLLPSGAFAETVYRGLAVSNGAALSTGRLTMVAINLPSGALVTNISFVSFTQALVAGTNQIFALYDRAKVLLGQSADDTSTAWGAGAVKTLALTTPYTTTYGGLHYLGISVAAGTVPTLACQTGSVTTTNNIAPMLAATADTGLTATAPNPAGAFGNLASIPYAYVS